MQKKIKINLVSLGCSKNTVDSESLAGELISEGFSVQYNMQKPSFNFVIINTCGFIDKAKEESINTILSFVELKKQENKDFKIIVFGCLAQRYKEELLKEIPEIDAIFGVMQQSKIISTIKEYCNTTKNTKPYFTRKLSNAKHYAYLKIAEGCNRRCSFCAIPLIKGNYVSRSIEDILEEANELIEQGVKELILIAQDTSCYGMDLYKKNRLKDLIVELSKTNIQWIRLQYSYPNQFPLETLDLMTENSKLCHYIDMPLQHFNDRILASMNRNITGKEITELISNIRNKVPDIALRTTLIVGYPEETKEEFGELENAIKNIQFDRMGAFTYSKEEGTKAALLNDNISAKEKQKRLDELTDIQQEISFDLNQKKIGKTFKVLIDCKEGEYFVGRTQYDSPEVDNEVLIPITENVQIGNFYNILITDAVEFDLYGRQIENAK